MSGQYFYLTLPSNSSMGVFPNNKTGYRVKLPQTVNLEGSWEVCLYSVSYLNTWYTLQKSTDSHLFYSDFGQHKLFEQAVIDYGYYESMQDLIQAANRTLAKNVNDNIKLTYNAVNGKVTVGLNNGYELGFFGRMSIILGFGGKFEQLTKTTVSPHVPDLTTISMIYVYCEIVESQVVGDTSAQLLKSIPAEGTFGDIITKTFTNIQYVPIQRKLFGDVEILLRSDTGDPVPFEHGKVVTTLHFRQHSCFS